MRKSLFIIITACSISCGGKAHESVQTDPANNIIIIFKKNHLANSAAQNQFYTKNFVRWYDSNFNSIQKELKNKTSNDTITIGTNDEFHAITLFHNYIYFNYLLKNGDTAVVDFSKDDIPFFNITNRNVGDWESNFPILVRKRFGQQLKGSNMIGPPPKNRPTPESRFNIQNANYVKYNNLIDSLLSKKAINSKTSDYFKNENKANLFQNIAFSDLRPYLYKLIEKDSIISFANRSDLLKYPYFQNFIEWYYIPSDILGIEKINLKQSRTLNYNMAYDKINAHFTNPIVKNYLLFYCLTKIKQEGTKASYNTYLAKFKLKNTNKAYIDILNENEIDNKGVGMNKNAVAVSTFNGKQRDLNDFVKLARGKVIYVDLWASWCAPCRAVMPASVKLKNVYQGKQIVFTYLSIDAKKSDWLKAAEEENLKDNENSFLLIDAKNSSYTKSLNLKNIPRYLIYNKRGELINANAPAPDDPKLKDLLDQYLTEK